MKGPLLFLLLLLSLSRLFAQNLIPNPDFETYSSPPISAGEYANATGWSNCNGGGSPDYFSTLGSGLVKLPNCFIGTLNPHSGNSCMGAAFYYYSPPNYREYLSIVMTTPMTIGKKYNVSFYISNGVTDGVYGGGGIDNISVAFSTNALKQGGTAPVAANPQYTYGSILYTKTWQLLSFQFTADSAYQYFTLGNFKSDAFTQYQQFDACTSYGAYYFFDDFNVSELAGGAPPVASFLASDSVLCANDCISFTNMSSNATSWKWIFNGAIPATSTDMNPSFVCYTSAGTFDVKLIATNAAGLDSITFKNYIDVAASPPVPVITQSRDTLICSVDPSYISYQWYANNILIPGATGSKLEVSADGNYNVQVTNVNGCSVAVGINIILGLRDFVSGGNFFALCPNPVQDQLTIQKSSLNVKEVTIYNLLSEKVSTLRSEILAAETEIFVDVSALSRGIYFLELYSEQGKWVRRFIRQ